MSVHYAYHGGGPEFQQTYRVHDNNLYSRISLSLKIDFNYKTVLLYINTQRQGLSAKKK